MTRFVRMPFACHPVQVMCIGQQYWSDVVSSTRECVVENAA
jgi:hypothetical protein